MEKGKFWKVAERGEREGHGGLWRSCTSLELWPAVWMAEWRSFRPKIWGGILLDEMNNSMVTDCDFNDQILRSMVEELNPKT